MLLRAGGARAAARRRFRLAVCLRTRWGGSSNSLGAKPPAIAVGPPGWAGTLSGPFPASRPWPAGPAVVAAGRQRQGGASSPRLECLESGMCVDGEAGHAVGHRQRPCGRRAGWRGRHRRRRGRPGGARSPPHRLRLRRRGGRQSARGERGRCQHMGSVARSKSRLRCAAHPSGRALAHLLLRLLRLLVLQHELAPAVRQRARLVVRLHQRCQRQQRRRDGNPQHAPAGRGGRQRRGRARPAGPGAARSSAVLRSAAHTAPQRSEAQHSGARCSAECKRIAQCGVPVLGDLHKVLHQRILQWAQRRRAQQRKEARVAEVGQHPAGF